MMNVEELNMKLLAAEDELRVARSENEELKVMLLEALGELRAIDKRKREEREREVRGLIRARQERSKQAYHEWQADISSTCPLPIW